MQFNIKTKTLLSFLKVLGAAVPRKTVLPVLENFHLTLKNGTMTAEASDGTVFLKTTIPVTNPEGEGNVLVPATHLTELLSTIDGAREITLKLDGEAMSIIWNDGAGHAKIPVFSTEDWPEPHDPAEETSTLWLFPLNTDTLCDALRHTIPMTIDDASKPALEAVLLDLRMNGVSWAVSSDTRVLTRYPLAADAGKDAKVLLPEQAGRLLMNVAAFLRHGSDKDKDAARITVSTDGIRTHISAGTFEMTCHHPTGKFPDYEKLLPQKGDTPLTINRQALLDSINRCSSVVTGSATLVIELTGSTIRTTTRDIAAKASAGEDLQFCDYAGEDLRIAFNAKKLTETLSLFQCEELRFDFNGERRAALLTATDDDAEPLLAIIMPVGLPKEE